MTQPSPDAFTANPRRHWPLVVLLIITALAYARLWSVGWSWDDEALILDNQVTDSLTNITAFFTRDLWGTTQLTELKSGYYRPLMLLSLAVDRALVGDLNTQLGATLSHVHSLLWHLGAVTALYALLLRFAAPFTAATGALLLAVHPLNAEVLALVAARNDSMAALFTLTALVVVFDRRSSMGKLLLAGVLFLFGMLSKESAVLAPLMLLTLDLARWKRPGALLRYVPFGISAGIYVMLRNMAEINQGISLNAGLSVLQENLLGVTALYGKLLVWPWPLSPARHINYLPPTSESLLGLAVLTGLVVAGLAFGKNRKLVVAGLIWAGLAFAPSLAATLDKGLLGERYLYFSMAGLGLAMVAARPRLPHWLAPALIVPAVVVLQIRLPQWQDSRTVWEAAHAAAPNPFTAAGLAWYYHRDQEFEQANPLLVMALEGDPPYRDVCDLIVMSHLEAKEPERATELAEWAVQERGCPPQGMIIDHWAVGLAGQGRWSEAVSVALRQPGGPAGPGVIVLAAARARVGQIDDVRRIAIQSGDPSFLQRVAKMLRLGGDVETAQRLLGQ